jgi:leucyl aminopeptidase
MQAYEFYQLHTEQAIELIVCTEVAGLSPSWQSLCAAQQFKAGLGEVVIIGNDSGQVVHVLIGQGSGTPAQAIAHAMTYLPRGVYKPQIPLPLNAQVMWSLAQYRYDQFKPRDSAAFRILCTTEEHLPVVLAEASAIFLVRHLINQPANVLGPIGLAQALNDLAQQHGAEYTQWVGDELLTDNFPAIHAVGRAAAEPPHLLKLTWGNPAHPHVTIVGKGVCFDSGGLDIKPSAGMRLMKKDMGGAAISMGLAHWVMSVQLPIYLQVWIPAVENAIGTSAYRPGDILTMRNGLTVEIDNTDAEGRLILADALVKACEQPPELLIDFATLTGAARVAVGTEISAFFTADETLATAIQQLGQTTGDSTWRLPLHTGYKNMLDSSIANLINSSPSSYAGAIIAALFLAYFVPASISWVHFDIMAWNVSNKPGRPEGGEAMGLQTMAAYLMQRYGQH